MALDYLFTEIEVEALKNRVKSEAAFKMINSGRFIAGGSKTNWRKSFLNVIELIELIENEHIQSLRKDTL